MLNLLLTIALQAAQPVYCQATMPDGETYQVPCSCGVTAKDLRRRVCTSDAAPDAIELKEVSK